MRLAPVVLLVALGPWKVRLFESYQIVFVDLLALAPVVVLLARGPCPFLLAFRASKS